MLSASYKTDKLSAMQTHNINNVQPVSYYDPSWSAAPLSLASASNGDINSSIWSAPWKIKSLTLDVQCYIGQVLYQLT